MSSKSIAPERAKARWGDALDAGFQIVPDVLLRYQAKLNLAPLDVVILLNVLLHWWTSNDLPFPRPATIATRIGVSSRSIERRLVVLEKKGLLKRLPPEAQPNGISIRRFDLSGLIAELQKYARSDKAFADRRARKSGASPSFSDK